MLKKLAERIKKQNLSNTDYLSKYYLKLAGVTFITWVLYSIILEVSYYYFQLYFITKLYFISIILLTAYIYIYVYAYIYIYIYNRDSSIKKKLIIYFIFFVLLTVNAMILLFPFMAVAVMFYVFILCPLEIAVDCFK